jgi:energy-coupling factor transporter ATP-binding protein EcfA2
MSDVETKVVARLDGASKRYGGVLALDRVDLEVRHGEVLAVLGPNGAGKTTAISLLLGLLRTDTGSATLFGAPPQALAPRRRIGAMLQTAGVPETLSVGELIELFRSYYPRPRTVADIVGRPAAPCAVRTGDRRQPGNPVSRRTDHGPGHRGTRDIVENDTHAGTRRLRDRADHALSRRSRGTR